MTKQSAMSMLAPTDQQDGLPKHYIETQTSLVGRALRTLKHGDSFAVLDSYGDMGTAEATPEGLFFRDTRYLSRFELLFEGQRPLLLNSVLQDDNAALFTDMANQDIGIDTEDSIPRDMIAIHRMKFLWDATSYDRIALRNHDQRERRFRIDFLFDSDFRDLFEVRGAVRTKHGTSKVSVGRDSVTTTYTGLDGVKRRATVTFDPPPQKIGPGVASYIMTMPARSRKALVVTVACEEQPRACPPSPFLAAYRDKRRALREITRNIATVETSNTLFNEVLCRSASDIYMLVSDTSQGPYPYAGIPWFSTIFGRDGIITAMMLLWVDPKIAVGVLRYLANAQATNADEKTDAEPGKILHERRHGEMARTGEVPFRRYYGTVDATPLFVMLAGMYFERTGDLATISELWPNIQAALNWCDTHGDLDGDGFVEYFRKTEHGLANQGWKDSQDSISHADGSLAEGPIALCEVQGYVFAAKHKASSIAEALGFHDIASGLRDSAERLRIRFEEKFWCEDIGTYALALDGAKRPCRVRASNAGHALFAGIASPERAARVAATLMKTESFSGWGIRTLASSEARYNPMSYHNGSVWPHDNAMIAMGFGRYDLKAQAAAVFQAMFETALYQEDRRLPELFCGFPRKRRRGPTSYPVACSPQAWAAAAPFSFISSCLGLEMSSSTNEIRFNNSILPHFLDEVIVRGLRLRESTLMMKLHRHGSDVALNVLHREGDARVIMAK